jgi:hypothetical protein
MEDAMRNAVLGVVHVAIVAALSGEVLSQTLPEQAKLGPVEQTIIKEYDPVDVDRLVADSDTIIVGRVQAAKVSLTRDQKKLITDYEVVITSVLKRSKGPGLIAGDLLVVRRDGGVTEIGGQRVVAVESDFPPLSIPSEHILFLKNMGEGGRYSITHGPQGVFPISNGTVRQLSENFGSWNRDHGEATPLASMISEIATRGRPR